MCLSPSDYFIFSLCKHSVRLRTTYAAGRGRILDTSWLLSDRRTCGCREWSLKWQVLLLNDGLLFLSTIVKLTNKVGNHFLTNLREFHIYWLLWLTKDKLVWQCWANMEKVMHFHNVLRLFTQAKLRCLGKKQQWKLRILETTVGVSGLCHHK